MLLFCFVFDINIFQEQLVHTKSYVYVNIGSTLLPKPVRQGKRQCSEWNGKEEGTWVDQRSVLFDILDIFF